MKKGLFLIALATVAITASLFAQVEVANNCAYTGNSSDECYTSDGTSNIIVYNCAPGSTSCGYYH